MNRRIEEESCSFVEIRILVFDISGIKLGADVEQIAEMLETNQARDRGIDLVWFHEKISFHGREVRYRSPKVLVIRSHGTPAGIIIDRPEDIRAVELDVIKPIPVLVEACIQPLTIWGVVCLEEKIVLLTDLYKLLSF